MNTEFTINFRTIKRVVYLMCAVLILAASSPLLNTRHAAAAAQVSNRSIQMSDASPSGNSSITSGVGSGVAVTYKVSFTPVSNFQSMVIDFCQENPIIGDTTCTRPAPSGSALQPTGVTSVSGTAGGTGWTMSATTPGQVKLSSTSNPAVGGTPQVFELTGITNPSTVGTFYARMYTYANGSQGTYTSFDGANLGNYVDYGGVALSTTNAITITARVQESLMFCVTKADPSLWTTKHDCTDPVVGNAGNYPALILGHGTPTAVLDSSQVDTGTVFSQMSTNATHGAVVNMHNSNTSCGGLSADNGTTCAIPAIGSTAAAMAAGSSGGAQFGLFVTNGTPDAANGTGVITAQAPYNGNGHVTPTTDVWYGMDNSTAGANVTSTYGDTVASAAAPTYRVENAYWFAATAGLTTPAGIYTANISLICTATF